MQDGPPAERRSDAALWESAALSEEGGSSEVAEADLTFQIDHLQRSLQERNLTLEGSLVEAAGALEGSLAAIRHLTCELDRLVAEVCEQLGEPPPATRRAPPPFIEPGPGRR